MLSENADMLLKIVETTTKEYKIEKAIDAINRYGAIVTKVQLAMTDATAANMVLQSLKFTLSLLNPISL